MVDVLEDTKAIVDFLKRDRVDAIGQEETEAGKLTELVVPKKMIENRMITVHIHLESVKHQGTFMSNLRTNQKFNRFYETRNPADKQEIVQVPQRSNLMTFQSIEVLLTFSVNFADDMIAHFVPRDEDGGDLARRAMMKEFEVSRLLLCL